MSMKLVLSFEQILLALREYVVNHNMLPKGNYHVDFNWSFNININGIELICKLSEQKQEQQSFSADMQKKDDKPN